MFSQKSDVDRDASVLHLHLGILFLHHLDHSWQKIEDDGRRIDTYI